MIRISYSGNSSGIGVNFLNTQWLVSEPVNAGVNISSLSWKINTGVNLFRTLLQPIRIRILIISTNSGNTSGIEVIRIRIGAKIVALELKFNSIVETLLELLLAPAGARILELALIISYNGNQSELIGVNQCKNPSTGTGI